MLHQVGALLRAHAVLLDRMMHSAEVVHMVRELLLHPVLPQLRQACDKMLRSAVLQAGPVAVLWLLKVRVPLPCQVGPLQ